MEDIFKPKGNWDNHKILLELALEETKANRNPILELGCGDGSSPCLRAYSEKDGRAVMCFDYHEEWAAKYGATFVQDWDKLDWSRHYSVALVDESPGEQRHKSLILLHDKCDIAIVHDSEPAATGYMLDKIWHLYKYKVDLVSDGAWATALSNTIDVAKWIGHKKDGYEVKDWNDRNKTIFVSVAFGKEYTDQQERLEKSIKAHYPDAPILFWTEELPGGAKQFLDSLYGFKPHAIAAALRKGFRKIVFLDPAVIINGDILSICESLVPKYGVLAAKDDNLLKNYCSEKALKWLGQTESSIEHMHLVGGSFYYFDFNLEMCKDIYNLWMQAEQEGYFGSQKEAASGQINSHRNDESMMALAIYLKGSWPIPVDILSYNSGENPLLLKKHFK